MSAPLYCCVRLCLAILYICLPALDVASSSFDFEKHKLFGVYGGVIYNIGDATNTQLDRRKLPCLPSNFRRSATSGDGASEGSLMAQPSDCHGGVASFEAWESTGTARFAIPSFEAGFLAVELTYGCMGSLFRHKELQGDWIKKPRS